MESKYTLSEDLSIDDIQKLYHNVVLKQDFYNSSYGGDWNINPFQDMAKIIINILNPSKHMDIGCGKGLLVQAMREAGIESFGLDFSEALIKSANPKVKKYLQNVSTENWIENASLNSIDLITYTEVFEHLPISVIETTLNAIYKGYNGKLLLTIPSYGVDQTFKSGIYIGVENHQWYKNMMKNIPFKNIVLESGLPHHGHITLAPYRWWTDFFLFNGFTRDSNTEKKTAQNYGHILERYNWNPYILKKAEVINNSEAIINTDKVEGLGWHDYEGNLSGRWTNGHAIIPFKYNSNVIPNYVKLSVSSPDINIGSDFSLLIILEQLIREKNYEFVWQPVYYSKPKNINGIYDETLEIQLFKYDKIGNDEYRNSNTYRLRLITPNFCPSELKMSDDNRNLGLFVRSIQILY